MIIVRRPVVAQAKTIGEMVKSCPGYLLARCSSLPPVQCITEIFIAHKRVTLINRCPLTGTNGDDGLLGFYCEICLLI